MSDAVEQSRVRHGELMPATEETPQEGPVYTPAIDIHESDAGLTLEADLPGVVPETLQIDVEDNVLRIFGRVKPYLPEGARPVYREYVPGSFARSFILGDEVDREQISARMKDGVLKLELPKAEQARPRRIEVRTG